MTAVYVYCIVCNDWPSLNYLQVQVGRRWIKKNYEELQGSS